MTMIETRVTPATQYPAGRGLECPECHSTEVVATVEHLVGITPMLNGEFVGQTETDPSSQKTITSVHGDPLVQCDGNHWFFACGYTVTPDGIELRKD
jgi:hypothetical protein